MRCPKWGGEGSYRCIDTLHHFHLSLTVKPRKSDKRTVITYSHHSVLVLVYFQIDASFSCVLVSKVVKQHKGECLGEGRGKKQKTDLREATSPHYLGQISKSKQRDSRCRYVYMCETAHFSGFKHSFVLTVSGTLFSLRQVRKMKYERS